MSDTVRIHPTAIIEDGVILGPGTSVWDNVHIRRGARLGSDCLVGEKTYIAYDVQIANRVKINAFVYICYGVTIEDGVMISAGTIFTNDRFPRACTPDLTRLLSSEPSEGTSRTLVAEGATVGARCVIGSDIRIGRFAMIGMGSVVSHCIDDFHLALGSPARSVGCVCRCGQPLAKWSAGDLVTLGELACQRCERGYVVVEGVVTEQPTTGSMIKQGLQA